MFKGIMQFDGIKTYIEYANLEKVEWEEIKNQPEKIPFIIVHGHTASHFFLAPIYSYFKDLGWPIITYDLRGHGWSEKNDSIPYRLDNAVEDLRAIFTEFLKKKFGYQKFNLLGHSMGGLITLKYYFKYPDSINKLILLSTAAKIIRNFYMRIEAFLLFEMYKRNYEVWFNKKKKYHVKLGPEFFPQWSDPTLLPDKRATIEFMEDIIDFNFENRLGEISVPTLVCVGSEDELLKQAKKTALKIPGSILDVMQGYEHNIGISGREVVPQRIKKFLEKSE